jgi:drug/metabolite transporter (DMT)-like permease
LALGVVYVMWGSTYLAIRYTIESVPPTLAAGLRFVVAGALLAVLLLVFAKRAVWRMNRREFGTSLLAGLLLIAGGNGLVTVAEQHITSGLAALLIASVPLYIVLLRRLFGDRPRVTTLVGVAVGLAGLTILLLAGPGQGGTVGNAWWGPWLVLFAALCWALGTFATTRMAVPQSPFVLATVEMLAGGGFLVLVGSVVGERLDPAAISGTSWLAWGYLSIIVSLGAMSAYAYALATLPVSTVATYAYVNPVIAVVLGAVIAGERFTPLQLIGGAVVVIAVVVVIASERVRRVTETVGPV